MIPFDLAYARILAPLAAGATETVALTVAARRVLAETLAPLAPSPPFAQVLHEGFALRLREAQGALPARPVELVLAGEAAAGHPYAGPLPAGAAVRVMTGAVLPQGADAVARLDDAREEGDRILLHAVPRPGQGFRAPGSDLAPTTALLPNGTWLTPARIQVAAAMGHTRARVGRRPRVAIFTTGDELVLPGTPQAAGQLPDCNAWGLAARVAELGGEPTVLGIVPDQRAALEATLYRAASQFDAVLSTGGISDGRYDHLSEVMDALGPILARDIALYPGKSPLVALIEGRPHFALPGNPASVAIAFELFVRPALLRMQGVMEPRPRTMSAHLSGGVTVPLDRHAGLLGRMRESEGALWVDLVGAPGANQVATLPQCNVLIHLPPGTGQVAAGALVRVQLLGMGEDA